MNLVRAGAEVAAAIRSESDRACCVYHHHMLELAYGLPPADREALSLWRLWVEVVDAHPWGPIEAVAAAGLAERVSFPPATPLAPPVGRWASVQVWRGPPGADGVTGHTYLWRQVTPTLGYALDSASTHDAGPTRYMTWAEKLGAIAAGGGAAVAVLRPAPPDR